MSTGFDSLRAAKAVLTWRIVLALGAFAALTRSPSTRGSLAAGSNCDNPRLTELARHGYVGLNQDARGRYGAKLVMTCCGHTPAQGLIGWGPEAQTFDLALTSRWFDHYLKSADNGINREPDVRIPAEP